MRMVKPGGRADRRVLPGLVARDHPGLIPNVFVDEGLQQPRAPLDKETLQMQLIEGQRQLMDDTGVA